MDRDGDGNRRTSAGRLSLKLGCFGTWSRFSVHGAAVPFSPPSCTRVSELGPRSVSNSTGYFSVYSLKS